MTMTPARQQEIIDRISARLHRLYPGINLERTALRLDALIGRYGIGPQLNADEQPRWSRHDAILITYGDSIRREGEFPLITLRTFVQKNLRRAIPVVHVLPFFPYSSDDGFSVINYRKVREDLGEWQDMQALGQELDLMFDLVINHVSRKSDWFKFYTLDVAPYRDFFIEVDPQTDLSAVVRPRNLPLLTPAVREGEKHYLWATFSRDQIDVDFANPDVLFEFIDILFYYLCQRARIIRLDAIAYLWKNIGTTCIHQPETHEVVKIFRDILDLVAPATILLTETNVPHQENISYFGNGDEAHMVYQFSLPPLVLHALLNGNAEHLARWAAHLAPPPAGCTFLNFTASHDGIGVRPLEGLIPATEIEALTQAVVARGGRVSAKRNPDGSTSPYELNITYFSALGPESGLTDPLHVERFLCSQTIAASLAGIPAYYIHSLTACPNDTAGAEASGHARSINRKQWDWDELTARLDDPASDTARVLGYITNMLTVRSQCPAFEPDAPQRIVENDQRCFAVERNAASGERVWALHNVTAHVIDYELPAPFTGTDLLQEGAVFTAITAISLAPYQCRWLCADGLDEPPRCRIEQRRGIT